jgi:hypothetical protein
MGEWRYSSTILYLSTIWTCSCHFTPWKWAPGTHWIGGWVGPRVSWTPWRREISCPYQEFNPGCPACSQSLYRLSYHRPDLEDLGKYKFELDWTCWVSCCSVSGTCHARWGCWMPYSQATGSRMLQSFLCVCWIYFESTSVHPRQTLAWRVGIS